MLQYMSEIDILFDCKEDIEVLKMSQVTGVVEEVKYNKVLVINGKNYSAFNPSQLSGATAGDTVQFLYKINNSNGNTYYNIDKNVTVVGKASANTGTGSPPVATQELPKHYMTSKGYLNLIKTFPMGSDHPDRSIVRQNAINVASALVASTIDKGSDAVDAAELTIKIAKILEKHTSGDLDANEAEQALKALSLTK